MPFIPVPRTFVVAVNGTYGGHSWTNVLHITRASSIVESDPTAIAQRVGTQFAQHVMPQLDSNVFLQDVTARNLGKVDEPTGAWVPAAVTPGGKAGIGATPNTAYLIRKFTSGGGKAGRGRMYLCGVGATTFDELGNVTAAAKLALQNAMTAFLDGVNGSTFGGTDLHMAVVSLYKNKAPRAEGLSAAVTKLVVDDKLATQRERMRR